jgi:hypothetical protein
VAQVLDAYGRDISPLAHPGAEALEIGDRLPGTSQRNRKGQHLARVSAQAGPHPILASELRPWYCRHEFSNPPTMRPAALKAIVGAMLQESSRTASTIIGVAASKLIAAGVMAGAFGTIGAFGVASTGTAIASLSGAAATTATLYWIGSTIGMGVAAGGLMLTGGAIVAGIPAVIVVRRRVLGRRWTEKGLSNPEQAALYAALMNSRGERYFRPKCGWFSL